MARNRVKHVDGIKNQINVTTQTPGRPEGESTIVSHLGPTNEEFV